MRGSAAVAMVSITRDCNEMARVGHIGFHASARRGAAGRQPSGPKFIHRATIADVLQPNLGGEHTGLVRAIGFKRGINLGQHFCCLALDVLGKVISGQPRQEDEIVIFD